MPARGSGAARIDWATTALRSGLMAKPFAANQESRPARTSLVKSCFICRLVGCVERVDRGVPKLRHRLQGVPLNVLQNRKNAVVVPVAVGDLVARVDELLPSIQPVAERRRGQNVAHLPLGELLVQVQPVVAAA